MKTKLNLIFILICLFSISCSNESDINDENIESKITTIDKLNSWINDNSDFSLNLNNSYYYRTDYHKIEFDYDNPVTITSNGTKFLIINQKGMDEKNSENVALTFIENENDLKEFMIVKTINNSSVLKTMEYYSFNDIKVFETKIDATKETVTNIANRADGYQCEASWGENTAACLDDVYSNHGWVSVWATIQSAFIPQTAVVLAVACAMDAYNPYSSGCYTNAP